MQQLLQEQRRCQATIHRTKWKLTAGRRSGSSSSTNSSKRSSPGSSLPASSTASQQEEDEPHLQQQQQQGPVGVSSTAAELSTAESAQLMHLRQLRAKCDDAQDYLVGLIHAHLQVRVVAVAACANTVVVCMLLQVVVLW
jgi:hypothetical protein